MKTLHNLSKIAIVIASIGLSAPALADDWLEDWSKGTMDLVSGTEKVVDDTVGWGMGPWDNWNKYHPDYLLVDKNDGSMQHLDGVHGKKMSEYHFKHHDYKHLYGDKLTDLNTHRTGVIKGVKSQGTMDVMSPNGKMVRYEYVTFKVKNMHKHMMK